MSKTLGSNKEEDNRRKVNTFRRISVNTFRRSNCRKRLKEICKNFRRKRRKASSSNI
jgi:hypothetical protein